MGHTPLGYKIQNGIAVVDEQTATKVRQMYQHYLLGESLSGISKLLELNTSHAGIKRMLLNKKYLGDSFYPQLIDVATFEKVAEELKNRATKLGRNNLKRKKLEVVIPTNFIVSPIKEQFKSPFLRAEYIYSLIESEVS